LSTPGDAFCDIATGKLVPRMRLVVLALSLAACDVPGIRYRDELAQVAYLKASNA
jgi:hypothetical protein